MGHTEIDKWNLVGNVCSTIRAFLDNNSILYPNDILSCLTHMTWLLFHEILISIMFQGILYIILLCAIKQTNHQQYRSDLINHSFLVQDLITITSLTVKRVDMTLLRSMWVPSAICRLCYSTFNHSLFSPFVMFCQKNILFENTL